jgi:hypothetical protein
VFNLFKYVKNNRLLEAAGGDYVQIPVLLARGAEVNAQDSEGKTALMRIMLSANPYNSDEWMKFTCVLEFLLEHGADVNRCDKEGNTALMLAAINGLDLAVEKLISAGADVNLKNKSGYTPLMGAIGKSSREVAAVLIQAGADIYASVDGSKSTRSEATFGPAYPSKNSEVHDVLRAAMRAVEQGRSIIKAIEHVIETQRYDENEEFSETQKNTERYLVQFNFEVIGGNLAKKRGCATVSDDEIKTYLRECGFRLSENGWVADAKAFAASKNVIDRTWNLLSYSLNNRKFEITSLRLLR